MIEISIAGIILGFTLAFMVGPVFFLLLELSLTRGVKEAIQFDLGVIIADVFFIVLIWFGAEYIDIQSNALFVFSIGGILIIFFGLYNIRNAKKKKMNKVSVFENPSGNALVYFSKGFFMNFLNAGVLAYWLSTSLLMKASVQGNSKLMITYFASTILAYFITDLGKIYFAQRLKSKLTNLVLIQIEKLVGIILVCLGVLMIFRGYLHANGYLLV